MVNRIQLDTLNRSSSLLKSTPLQSTTVQRQQFTSILESELGKTTKNVQFSAHAKQRLSDRGIALQKEELESLTTAVDQVAAKGARESLVLLDRVALVVNVPNRKVITAMSTGDIENNVFTNIDSAVVAAPVEKTTASEMSMDGLAPNRGSLGVADRSMRRIPEELK